MSAEETAFNRQHTDLFTSMKRDKLQSFIILSFLSSLFATGTASAQTTLTLAPDNIEQVIDALTLDEKAKLLVGAGLGSTIDGVIGIPILGTSRVPGAAGATQAVKRLGIPDIILCDGPAGVRIKNYKTTSVPCGISLASMRDPEMVELIGALVGNEAKEFGVDVLLAPGMNIMRNPLCGRNYEYFSEDPELSGYTAAAYIRGVQSQGVGCTAKHFACNNQETGRKGNDSQVDEQTLRNIYLRPFEIVVKEAQPWTVMTSYNKLNGTYTSESKWLLTDVLRGEWGFDGLVMTDWDDAHDTKAQIAAGNDLLEAGASSQTRDIKKAVNNGTLSIDAVNTSVRRLLQLIIKTPTFSGYKYSNAPDLTAHAKLSRLAAAKGCVLLKNDDSALPILPNQENASSIALFGASSYDLIAGGKGSGSVNTPYVVHLSQGLENAGFTLDGVLSTDYTAYANDDSNREKGTGITALFGSMGKGALKEKALDVDYIRAAAERNDLAVITIGKQSGEEVDRDVDKDFNLTATERAMLENVVAEFHALGKRVIVVLNICGVVETASWKDLPDAILCSWLPGMEGGNAIADVLTGKVIPSGRLPMTFPRSYADVPSQNFGDKSVTKYTEGENMGRRYYDAHPEAVSYPYGYGLTYYDMLLVGDGNGDGRKSIADLTYLIQLLIDEKSDVRSDINRDGMLNKTDAEALVRELLNLNSK